MTGSSETVRKPYVLYGHQTWRWYAQYLRDPISCFLDAREIYGPVGGLGNPLPFWKGGRQHVMAFGAVPNRIVFGQPDLFRPGGQVLRGPRGSAQRRMRKSIFAMHGDEHNRHRRVMQPPLSRLAVASYAPAIAGLIDQVLDRWEVGKPIDAYHEMLTLSNWIAAHLLFGEADFERSLAICMLIRDWITLDVEVRTLKLRPSLPGALVRRLLRHAETLEAAVRQLIEERRSAGAPGKDLLSQLIGAHGDKDFAMSDDELVAHSVILHGASFLTTASTLAWAMYLLAQNPAVAAALDREVASKLTAWPPATGEIDAMPLLDGVLRETLRLLPPVHHTLRTVAAPTDALGLQLRRDDRVIMSAFMSHREPTVFPEPDVFDPARWIRDRPGPYDYIPFSAGPRLCLGYAFATLEMKMILARIVQRHRVALVPHSKIDVIYRLTLCPSAGVPMTVEPRDGAFSAAPVSGNILKLVRHG